MSRFGPVPMDVPVVLSREDARRLAEQELLKAKYNGLPDWVGEALRRINLWLQQVMDYLNRIGGAGGHRLSPGVVVVALLLVAAVVIIIWRVGLPRLRHRAPEQQVDVDSARSPLSYRDQAEQLAAAGDFRAAIGDRFRAVVRELEERTLLDVRPARTASEVATSAGLHLPEHRAELDRLAALFNDAWYSDRAPTVEDYRQVCELDDAITAASDRADLSASAGVPG